MPDSPLSPVHSPESVSHAAAFCSDRKFCIEVFARRASLCSFLRTALPSSLAIGSGCSQAAAAPIVPVDILTQGGFALCASWVREPQCAWVHIRCPKSLFYDVSGNSLSSVAEQCVCAISNLLKHCKDAECHWTIEAPSRSTFWSTWLGKQLLPTVVDVSLSSFGSFARGCIRFASSAPSCLAELPSPYPVPAKACSEVVLGRLYRSLATAMLAFLNVQAPIVPPLEAAQIGTGGQPRKTSFSPVPEFKLFMQVPLQSVPKLDGKNRLLEPLCVQGVACSAHGFKAFAALSLADSRIRRRGCVEQLSIDTVIGGWVEHLSIGAVIGECVEHLSVDAGICLVITWGGDTLPCPCFLPCFPLPLWFRGCRLRS